MLVEATNNSEAIKNELNNTIEKQHETFNKDREILVSQKDEIYLDLVNKNKQIALLQNKYDSIETKLNKKLEGNRRLKIDIENANNKYISEINEYKNKIIKSEDDLLNIKVEYDKKIALSDQHNKFNKKQIEDLSVSLTNSQKQYEEALKNSSDKDDSKLLRDTLERISKEKNE